LFHPVLQAKNTGCLIARRQQLAGAAAKMVSTLRSMTPHRIDALRSSCHTAKQSPKVADQPAPTPRIQTQPRQNRRQIGRCDAPFSSNHLPGRPVEQFEVILDRDRQKPLLTASLARFAFTGPIGSDDSSIDNGDKKLAGFVAVTGGTISSAAWVSLASAADALSDSWTSDWSLRCTEVCSLSSSVSEIAARIGFRST